MGRPRPESARSRQLAHLGGVSAATALLIYVTWRIAFTLPDGGWDRTAAWLLVTFEALPLLGLVVRLITLWNIDCSSPEPITEAPQRRTVAVWLPTYNEPVEVIAPAIAAACELQPAHQTWVLDDGDREWVAQLCAAYGARYVRRDVHDHAKAGNMNHALDLMTRETAQGAEEIDIIAVLDCDHVPLPTFLTATLGWFDDPKIALVRRRSPTTTRARSTTTVTQANRECSSTSCCPAATTRASARSGAGRPRSSAPAPCARWEASLPTPSSRTCTPLWR